MLLYWVESVLARETECTTWDLQVGVKSKRVKVEVNPGSVNGTPH